MAGAVVTTSTSGLFIEMIWNDYALYFKKTKLRISTVRSINIVRDIETGVETGLQVVFDSHNSEIFKYSWFANINGVTDLDNYTKLYNAFDNIID